MRGKDDLTISTNRAVRMVYTPPENDLVNKYINSEYEVVIIMSL